LTMTSGLKPARGGVSRESMHSKKLPRCSIIRREQSGITIRPSIGCFCAFSRLRQARTSISSLPQTGAPLRKPFRVELCSHRHGKSNCTWFSSCLRDMSKFDC
jgi:hypothetical protein